MYRFVERPLPQLLSPPVSYLSPPLESHVGETKMRKGEKVKTLLEWNRKENGFLI